MEYETVLYEEKDKVAIVTLNRPDRMNAITRQLQADLFDALHRAEENEDVRVIILTGAGRGFCAGADMKLLGNTSTSDWSNVSNEEWVKENCKMHPRDDTREDFRKTNSYFPAISKPIIGALNGATVGLGFVLPLYCDIRFASDQARFGTAFAQRGLIAEHGVSWMLPRLIGISNAFDLLYSARLINADEALRMGLVSRVIPHDSLMDEVLKYANHLANNVSPRSLRLIKKEVYNALFQTLAEATDAANLDMADSFRCDDFKEGVAHFVEKRAPNFTGK
ncbi:MAG: enoyl-CoA hydratase [Verrucomicrobia bacterium]|nr:enoyl-CoA hydratase [Verrucomicrobiota bacterium]MDA1069564.1 enoyl-CoA hydratase [Verrucomicrobiota bacterium]